MLPTLNLTLWLLSSPPTLQEPDPAPTQRHLERGAWRLDLKLYRKRPRGQAVTHYRFGRLPHLQIRLHEGTEPLLIPGPATWQWPMGPTSKLVIRGPDGIEHFAGMPPFSEPAGDPIRVDPEVGLEWRGDLGSRVRLSAPGPQEVWVEFADATGQVHRSEPVSFLSRVCPPSEPGLKVAIEVGKGNQLTAVFRNDGRRPTTIMRPRDGSLYGWLMPHYYFEGCGPGGEKLDLEGRCGNYGGDLRPEWFERMEPGQERRIPVYLPLILPAGRNTVRFHYLMQYRPRSYSNSDFSGGRSQEFPAEVERIFYGRIAAESFVLEVPGCPWSEVLLQPMPDLMDRLCKELVHPTPINIAGRIRSGRARALDVLDQLRQSGVLGDAQYAKLSAVMPAVCDELDRELHAAEGDGSLDESYFRRFPLAEMQQLAATGLLAGRERRWLRAVSFTLEGKEFHSGLLLRVTLPDTGDHVEFREVLLDEDRGPFMRNLALAGLAKLGRRDRAVRELFQVLQTRTYKNPPALFSVLAYVAGASAEDFYAGEARDYRGAWSREVQERVRVRWLDWWREHERDFSER